MVRTQTIYNEHLFKMQDKTRQKIQYGTCFPFLFPPKQKMTEFTALIS